MDKLKDHENRIVESENNIILLKSLSGGGGNKNSTNLELNGGESTSGLMDAFGMMIENLRKEMYAKFAERDDYNRLKKRIEELENKGKGLEE